MRFDAGKSKRSGTALPPSYHGCAAVGLCVFTGATTMAAVATMPATKPTRSIFEAVFARLEEPKMECCLVEKRRLANHYVYSNSVNSELEKLQNPLVFQLNSVELSVRETRE